MDLGEFKAALAYPWNGGESGTTLVLGGILTLLSPLLLPALVVGGYGIEVLASVLEGEAEPPRFDDPGETIVTGLKAAAVVVVYVGVPLAIGTAALAAVLGLAGVRFGGGFPTPGRLAGVDALAAVFGLVLSVLVIGLSYLAPAALVQLARTDRVRAAFDFDAVRSLVSTDVYASAWLFALLAFVATNVVVAVANVAAGGLVLGGFVTFYAILSVNFLLARAAREAGRETSGTGTGTAGGPGPDADGSADEGADTAENGDDHGDGGLDGDGSDSGNDADASASAENEPDR